ncbi:hypothetical protein OOK13_01705 [Streptomyces sp. NBC_00378]|nr:MULTISPECIES: hypothetical protein [unclassified Streptomyces]MCX5107263.1 hypothetical protein [Streptomyces sp. NBC_00378]
MSVKPLRSADRAGSRLDRQQWLPPLDDPTEMAGQRPNSDQAGAS